MNIPPKENQVIQIGPYTIYPITDSTPHSGAPGKIWIKHENGEGMETSVYTLLRALDKFWDREF